MAFGSSGADDVATLIARKQYAKAIEAIKAQLKSGRPDPRLRLQLADVFILAQKEREAVAILLPLADEYAKEGFAAKAISVLKKIQKIDPGRRDIEPRLAALIETKQKQATVSLPPAASSFEIGMEEIGSSPMDLPPAAPAFELGMESAAPIEVPVAVPPPPFFKPPSSEPPPPPFPANLPVPSAPPAMPPAARPEPMPVEDHDLISGAEFEEVAPIEAMPAVAPPSFASSDEFSFGAVTPELDLDGLAAAAVEAEPILEAEAIEEGPVVPDAAFANDVLAAIDEIFPSGIESSSLSAAADIDETPAGTQIVVSPLFKNFAVDEMVLVIQGLKLLTFEPRQIILKQGEPGNSLYMLTSGRVRAFIKDPTTGKQRPLADLEEGAFFGEMSILTGKPRTATIVAAERSELLELDRATLDSIVKTHPHVWDVLKEFAELRMQASGS